MTNTETATLAAGCFWGVEALFQDLDGVLSTQVGYTGGTTVNPVYQDVCAGQTGHAEAVQLTFNPDVIGYDAILTFFFRLHDPTTLNRQGPDVGTQYRSAIFYHTDAQQEAANAVKSKLVGQYKQPIVTDITPASIFYPAETYHQQYFKKRGIAPSCHGI